MKKLSTIFLCSSFLVLIQIEKPYYLIFLFYTNNNQINSFFRMLKNKRVNRLLLQNNIQRDNITLVIRLKSNIQELNGIIRDQQNVIEDYKRNVKSTKINQMEIEIQHLNDQNRRLLFVIDQLKVKYKTPNYISSKKMIVNSPKVEERRPVPFEIKVDNKIYDVLKENEVLKKELLNLKINQNHLKKRPSTLNDRSSIFIQKKLIDCEKLHQKKIDLQAQKVVLLDKIKNLQGKVSKLSLKNDSLEALNIQKMQNELQF